MFALFGVAAFFLFLLFPNLMQGQTQSIFSAAANLIASLEGFVSTSRWDYKQYSWGYGTAAPGPNMTITESQARAEMLTHVQSDYDYLLPLITVSLNTNQWAALLSFAYNEGKGNADNLVANINAQDWPALGEQWLKYVYAGGNYNAGLAARRETEWNYFTS